jgi:hypothetical protein
MKNKKWLLVLIILIPSLMWVILESSTINSYKLYHYGPKKVLGKNDTDYYEVPDKGFYQSNAYTSNGSFAIDTANYPFYAIMFIKNHYANESYRVAGLWEYLNYKKEKVGHIPFFLVTEDADRVSVIKTNLEKFNSSANVHFLSLGQPAFDSINKLYFSGKPIYIDFSFFALIDNNRNIRGYYDGRFVAEIKRLIEEYKHLRLKEEKEKLIHENEVKSNS